VTAEHSGSRAASHERRRDRCEQAGETVARVRER
jgi:hypothetical protein